MPEYPTADEFKRILLSEPLDNIAEQYIFRGLPYAFREAPASMEILREHLRDSLDVLGDSTIVIGSARTGFSLSPDSAFRQFSDESDIDVLIVDQRIFDEIWSILLKWHYPRRLRGLQGVDNTWGTRRRRELYWGWFLPDKIRYEGLSFPDVLKPLRDISTTWFNAFKSLSRLSQFSRRDVSGRLYRTWDHARLYQVDGLRQIKEVLSQTKKDI